MLGGSNTPVGVSDVLLKYSCVCDSTVCVTVVSAHVQVGLWSCSYESPPSNSRTLSSRTLQAFYLWVLAINWSDVMEVGCFYMQLSTSICICTKL